MEEEEEQIKMEEIALQTGEPFLTEEQRSVVAECLTRNAFGLSLFMGSGKTILSIIVALKKKINQNQKQNYS